ncbi:MAG: hypothetical protein HQ536_00865, partial [Parcubacteria group bacterium]|nr:hypothetical protein [Parcubacteria group bacterium]
MEGAKDILYKVILAGLFLALVFPLFRDAGSLLFPLGRDVLFRALIGCLVFLYLLLLYYDTSFLPKISPILVSTALFWVISGLATAFSAQPLFSFFGNPFRGHGFLSQTHHFIYFLLLAGIVKKWEDWRKMLWLAVIVSFPAGLLSIWEALNGAERVQATLNNTNFYSAYLLLVMFITVALFFRQKRPFLLKGEAVSKKVFLILAFILQFFGVMFSRSRGAYVG